MDIQEMKGIARHMTNTFRFAKDLADLVNDLDNKLNALGDVEKQIERITQEIHLGRETLKEINASIVEQKENRMTVLDNFNKEINEASQAHKLKIDKLTKEFDVKHNELADSFNRAQESHAISMEAFIGEENKISTNVVELKTKLSELKKVASEI